ncbi:hypothetical protein Q4Q35_06715 [Flavivirga aquimarina]|uniref:Na+-driven multidrug efflux pump n=1 Tax=Flavivirga aquimarina TaxID=2027862 RepID=A0ABT8W8W4_9FLAO|nr:oligosaccharide flippase family protein [Flavivirga aquimarina]MDO5969492.1 hypothetical protein [Flavivirga aquimarina]
MNIIIKNTGFLYLKSILSIAISLISTRYALEFLGEDLFGTFIVIAGVISSLAFLNGAMSVGIQRYMSYYQGKDNLSFQKKIFCNGFVLQLILAITIVLLLTLVEDYLFNQVLVINEVDTSKLVYRIMLLSIFMTISSVPFISTINAHEEMHYIAIVGFIQVILVFILSVSLKFTNWNRLLFYGSGMVAIQLIINSIYAIICFKRYPEITFSLKKHLDKKFLKELISFCGWNTIGAITGTLKNQGIAILLNAKLGTSINAAYGVAGKVSEQLNFFSVTLQNVINPQIMKNEGSGERDKMINLSFISSRASFFLFGIFSLPLIFEGHLVLNLWLIDVPENTTNILRILLVAILINQASIGCVSGIQAIGNIRNYYIIVGGSKILMLPISFVILYLKFDVIWVFINYAFFELFASFLRVLMFSKISDIKISLFLNKVLYKEMIPTLITVLTSVILVSFLPEHNRFLISIPLIVITFISTIFVFGMDLSEQKLIKQKIKILYENSNRRNKYRK